MKMSSINSSETITNEETMMEHQLAVPLVPIPAIAVSACANATETATETVTAAAADNLNTSFIKTEIENEMDNKSESNIIILKHSESLKLMSSASSSSSFSSNDELLENELFNSVNVDDKNDQRVIDEILNINEQNNAVLYIKESVRDSERSLSSTSTIEAMSVPARCDTAHSSGDLDEEEPDTLSPLMIDNHTYLQHQELMRDVHPHHHHHQDYSDAELILHAAVDDEIEDEEFDEISNLNVVPATSMKHSDTKDSISSIDSDVSLSFDRHDSTESHPQQEDGYEDNENTSSDDNAKDSGCDDAKKHDDDDTAGDKLDTTPIEIPSDDMSEKIVEQVEFYFSDENILKDAFLLKHVRRNKEGFVSLKLVSSFKRVRQLIKDWRVVGYAIKKKSKKIELNDLETKIRRLEPLPSYDETTPSRTVVATGLPFNKLTIEKVSDLFSKCGEIALIRLLRPGAPIPADVRQFINKHPELQQNECALVEFTESSSARRAQEIDGLIVFELIAPKKKTGKKANITKFIENYKYNTESDIERSRGGENRFKLKRNNSAFYTKPATTEQTYIHTPPRKLSYGNENYDSYQQNRRFSNCSINSADMSRKYSSCSEGYSSCSEMSRRPSNCSDLSRRLSHCSGEMLPPARRQSNCSEHGCQCTRRMSQYSDNYNSGPESRRVSQCSEHSRKFSMGSNFEGRRFSQDMNYNNGRKTSFDSNYERKYSNGSITFDSPRKFSAGFENITRKVSNPDQYYNGRKMSTDSGYDRRISIGSDYSASSSRRGSLLCAHNNAETVVRTPIGPDGSKGFSSRTRKVGQIIAPV